ncbi:MAG: hypothetical protein PVI01_04320, partial [Gemmatimonadales bacterium]
MRNACLTLSISLGTLLMTSQPPARAWAGQHPAASSGVVSTVGAAPENGSTLRLEPVSRLRDIPADGIELRIPATAARDVSGRFLLPNGRDRSEILVFNPSGQLAQRIRTGDSSSPQRRMIQILDVDSEGRLHVLDAFAQQHATYSQTLDLLDVQPVPVAMGYTGAAHLKDGSVVVNFAAWTPEHIGRPIRVVDPRGNLMRSIGDNGAAIRTDQSGLTQQRHIARAGETTFWAAHTNQYLIELWDVDGTKVREVRREVPWFQPWATVPQRPNERPETRIVALRRRGDGLLAVLLRKAADSWRTSLRPANDGRGGYLPSPPEGYWDTVVELLDETTGEVVASESFGAYLVAFAGDNHVVGHNEDAQGDPYVDIWRLSLNPR